MVTPHPDTESPWHTFADKLKPDVVIACLVIIVTSILMLCGLDSEIKGAFCLAIGWLFGGSYRESNPTPAAVTALFTAMKAQKEGKNV